MKERVCYICEHPLEYSECLQVNYSSTKEKLEKIWESKYTEIICCSCKRFIEQLHNGPLDLYRLLEWAQNGRLLRLKELNLICESDIIELKRLKNNG